MKDEKEKNPHASALGRLGGAAKTAKKIAASRRNIEKAIKALAIWRSKQPKAPKRRVTSSKKYQYEVSPGKWVSRQRLHQLRNPDKHAARQAAQKLQRQPCEKCGTTVKVQAHHDDYANPLAVQWLCHEHHKAADKARRNRLKK